MATGICGFVDWTPEERAEADRLRVEEAQRAAAAAEWGAELRRRASAIDLMAGRHMAPQLERQRPVIKPIDKARFRELQEFCKQNDWPSTLPIVPHALYEHVVSES